MTTFKRLFLLVTLLLVPLAAASSASAAVAPAPGWTLESLAEPSHFSTADTGECLAELKAQVAREDIPCDSYEVTARNAGSEPTSGPVTLTDTLPTKGLTVASIALFTGAGPTLEDHAAEDCVELPALEVRCAFPAALAPDQTLRLVVYVTVNGGGVGGTESLTNSASISGGGAGTGTAESNNAVGSPPPFGFSLFGFAANAPNGALDTQAGDHPYELTTTIGLSSSLRINGELSDGSTGVESPRESTSVEDPRDVVTDLPVGFVGSILAAPQCTFGQLAKEPVGCPPNTIVGHILTEPAIGDSIDSPIYNMAPEKGVPAEFAYTDTIHGTHVFYVHVVPTPKGYVLQTINPEIPQIALKHIVVTFYGDPAGKDNTGNAPIPFFTNPTDCTGEEPTATIYMDSWAHPARFNADGTPANIEEEVEGKKVWARMESKAPPVTGCDGLRFPAEITAQPTTHESDTPSGMEFAIRLPQSETVGVPATPTLQSAIVRLPEGFTVDPAAGDGLAACSETQIGWMGPLGPGAALAEKGLQNFNAAVPSCPEASKIGSLELESPLVSHALKGELFLASQNENPYNSTLAAYVVVHDPITGVLIKIAGRFTPNPNNGQLTAEFAENPNLPFSNLELHFFGGPRAELATPESCGIFTVGTTMSPWSFPESGPAAEPFDRFLIDEACPNGAFAPPFTAGSQNLQAGAYTNFVASFERSDTEQELAGLTVTLPPGLSAKVAGMPECGEAEIQATEAGTGGCPQSSQIGTVQAGVGPGPDPFFATGKAYWTGPYNGGSFGVAVVVPAVAGPYNFGTVVVRQSIRINPYTAQVTDVSDPFPTIIDGIPLRMRRVDVEFNRPNFTFNPTSCAKQQFTGLLAGFPLGAPTTVNAHTVGYSTQPGATHSFTTPLQVTNCASLKFTPKFAVSTSGKTSKAYGASLTAKLTEPNESQGSQANIAKVKVELPKQLPSRLSTLQKACTNAQFEANPAGCPKESMIGFATVKTPILAAPLSGPAIFVSHGGEAFPSLTMLLQGDGVTIDLVGTTFISKAGITSTTFKTVPDTPFSTFELTLPTGKFSALAANGNLCTQKLTMPTEFIGQNGAAIRQTTKISVSGCAKTRTRAQQLAAALKACKKDKRKTKRQACGKTARQKYGTQAAKHTSKGRKK